MILQAPALHGDTAAHDQPPSIAQIRICLFCDKELSSRIDIENLIECLGSNLAQRAEMLDPRVGIHDVDAPKVGMRLFEETLDISGVTDVSLDGNGFAAKGLDSGDNLSGGGGARSVVDDEVGTAFGELESSLSTHATGGASDEGDFAIKRNGRDRHAVTDNACAG
jgi:hypothetical protein